MINLWLNIQPPEASAKVLDCHNRETFDTNITSLSTDYCISESLLAQNWILEQRQNCYARLIGKHVTLSLGKLRLMKRTIQHSSQWLEGKIVSYLQCDCQEKIQQMTVTWESLSGVLTSNTCLLQGQIKGRAQIHNSCSYEEMQNKMALLHFQILKSRVLHLELNCFTYQNACCIFTFHHGFILCYWLHQD